VLIAEYPIWRQLSTSAGRAVGTNVRTILVTEAQQMPISLARAVGRISRPANRFLFRANRGPACIVYSSGTGAARRLHDDAQNYLEQCVALTSLYPFWPGVRYLSILPTNHRLILWLDFGPFTAAQQSCIFAHCVRIRA